MDSPLTALAPFDAIDADVILQSGDKTSFRVYRHTLSLASPYFKTMLSLPQPPNDHQGPDVVFLTEDAESLDSALRIIYPIASPNLDDCSPEYYKRVLEIGRKYDMEAVVHACAQGLLSLIRELVERARKAEKPKRNAPQYLQLYALACQYDLEAVARNIASASLAIPLSCLTSTHVPELDTLSANALRRLVDYHIACSNVMAEGNARRITRRRSEHWLADRIALWNPDRTEACPDCKWSYEIWEEYVATHPKWHEEWHDWLGGVLQETPGFDIANSLRCHLRMTEFASRCANKKCMTLRNEHLPEYCLLLSLERDADLTNVQFDFPARS